MLLRVCRVELITRRLAIQMSAAVCAATGALLCYAAGPALAEPADPAPPGCTAADLARVSSAVAADTSGYLFAHPDVNAFFTGLKGEQRDEFSTELQAYMDANPQVHADLQRIRQPLADQRDRCN